MMGKRIHDTLNAENEGFVFGLWDECPEHTPVAWGARAIAERSSGFSTLPDRQTWGGDKVLVKAFGKMLNQGPIERARLEAKELRETVMYDSNSECFTLYEDPYIVVKGNTKASFGHMYLIAYPKHEEIELGKVKPASENTGIAKSDDVFWSGSFPIPEPGDTVDITRPQLGKAIVIAHRVENNYLFLIAIPEDGVPDWYIKQNKDRHFPPSHTWNVTGAEIGPEVIKAKRGE